MKRIVGRKVFDEPIIGRKFNQSKTITNPILNGWIRITAAYAGETGLLLRDKKFPLTAELGKSDAGFTELNLKIVVPKAHAGDLLAGLTKDISECSADLTIDNIPHPLDQ